MIRVKLFRIHLKKGDDDMLRVSVIGVGSISEMHIKPYLKNEEVDR